MRGKTYRACRKGKKGCPACGNDHFATGLRPGTRREHIAPRARSPVYIDSKQLCKSVSPIFYFWAQMQVVRVCRNLRTSDFLLSRDWIGAPRSYGHYIGIVHICGAPKGACRKFLIPTTRTQNLSTGTLPGPIFSVKSRRPAHRTRGFDRLSQARAHVTAMMPRAIWGIAAL